MSARASGAVLHSATMRLTTLLSLLLSATSVAACGAGDDSDAPPSDGYAFGAAEVRAVTTGDFKGTTTIAGRPATTLTLRLDQAPASTTRAACGNRALMNPQCISTTSMQLTGTLSTDDRAFEAVAVKGSFDAYGEQLTQGTLLVVAGATTFSFPWSKGAFGAGTVVDAGGKIGDATLGR